MDADTRHIQRIAARTAAELSRSCRGDTRLSPLRRLQRAACLAGQAVTRKARILLREHWDLGLFDVLFGSIKAFAIYPALYFSGFAWTIPIMETVPLNTQLWTAAYLGLRGRCLSELGRRRYGHSLNRLDSLRDHLLRAGSRDAAHVHRFTLGGTRRVLRIRRSRWRSWLAAWRRKPAESGVATQAQLRRLVGDPEFLFQANPLRANPYLYEEVLLARLLVSPQANPELMALTAPLEPLTGEGRALDEALGESHEHSVTRLTAQAEALAASLRAQSGPITRCLRWIHASLLHAARRRLRELADLEYRLLAEIANGSSVAASRHSKAIRCKRAELRAAIARAGRLATRAQGLSCISEAQRLARRALAEARADGLAMRRAHLAAWLGGCLPATSLFANDARSGTG